MNTLFGEGEVVLRQEDQVCYLAQSMTLKELEDVKPKVSALGGEIQLFMRRLEQ